MARIFFAGFFKKKRLGKGVPHPYLHFEFVWGGGFVVAGSARTVELMPLLCRSNSYILSSQFERTTPELKRVASSSQPFGNKNPGRTLAATKRGPTRWKKGTSSGYSQEVFAVESMRHVT